MSPFLENKKDCDAKTIKVLEIERNKLQKSCNNYKRQIAELVDSSKNQATELELRNCEDCTKHQFKISQLEIQANNYKHQLEEQELSKNCDTLEFENLETTSNKLREKLNKAQQQISKIEKENLELQIKSKNLQETLHLENEHRYQLKKTVQELLTKTTELTNSNQLNTNMKLKYSDLQKQFQLVHFERHQLMNKVSSLEKMTTDYQEISEELKHRNDDLSRKILTLEGEKSSVKKGKEELEIKMIENLGIVQENVELKQYIDNLEEKLQKSSDCEECKKCHLQISILEKEMIDKQVTSTKLKDDLENKITNNEKEMTKVILYGKKLKYTNANLGERIIKMEDEISNYQDESMKLKQTNTELKNKTIQLEDEISKHLEKFNEVQNTNETLNKKIIKMRRKLSEHRQTLKELKYTNTDLEKKIIQMEDELFDHQEKSNNLKNINTNLENKITILQNLVSTYQETSKEFKNKNVIIDKKIVSIEKEMALFQSDLKKASTECNNLQSQISILKKESKNYPEECEHCGILQELLQSKIIEVDELKSSNISFENEIKVKTEKCPIIEVENNDVLELRNQISQKMSENVEIKSENVKLKHQLSKLEEQLQTKSNNDCEECKKLQLLDCEDCKKLQLEISILENKCSSSNNPLTENAEQNISDTSIKDQIDSLTNQITELKAELERKSKILTLRNAEIAILTQEAE